MNCGLNSELHKSTITFGSNCLISAQRIPEEVTKPCAFVSQAFDSVSPKFLNEENA